MREHPPSDESRTVDFLGFVLFVEGTFLARAMDISDPEEYSVLFLSSTMSSLISEAADSSCRDSFYKKQEMQIFRIKRTFTIKAI